MSKTTKIIAALGVVAGLGVAALPAFTFAEGEPSVTGNVDVVVEVQPAIAMTITGNNDDDSHYPNSGADRFTEVETPGEASPVTQGWYELVSDEYVPTSDITVVSGKKYYSFTGTYRPVDTFAPGDVAGKTLDGHTIPPFAITGPSSSYAAILPNAKVEGSAGNGFRSTVTVFTNANGGYTLSVKDADSITALTHTSGAATGAIPTQGSALTPGTAGWNYDVIRHGQTSGDPGEFVPTEGGTTEELTNQAITTENVVIDNWTGKTSSGRDTVVDYNVATSGDQATGVYTDTIIYTATTR